MIPKPVKYKELSVRTDPKLGDISDEVYPLQAPSPMGKRKVIILIHGYNVDEDEARIGYEKFLKQLKKNKIPKIYNKSIWKFYWPGNCSNSLLSLASYPFQVSKTETIAKLLSQYLIKLHSSSLNSTEFIFISHSLGCRVILETINLFTINTENAPVISTVFLMAAAVPVYMLQNSKRLENAVKYPNHRNILFSSHDSTLNTAFPIGQTFAFEGFFPEAVGTYGNPRDLDNTTYFNSHLEHGEYWENRQIAKEVITNIFRLAAPRETPFRLIKKYTARSYTFKKKSKRFS